MDKIKSVGITLPTIKVSQYLNQQGDLFPYEAKCLNEIIWPSSHQSGVPDLDIALMAMDITEPFRIWGEVSRKTYMPGTYAFYVDDYKFNRLWRDPDAIVRSGCTATVEPNFSIHPRMPFPVALYEIFRKRWLSRYWQSQGVQIVVDMNVGWPYLKLNLLGVPRGWRSYATRAHKGEHDVLLKTYHLCQTHADTTDILYIVYGGGKYVEGLCQQYGWRWVPEKMHTQRRKQKGVQYEKDQKALRFFTSGR